MTPRIAVTLLCAALVGCDANTLTIDEGSVAGAGNDVSQAISARRCPNGPTVLGIDVSIYQHAVNWSAVKGSGVEFAIARVSDGTGSIDSTFAGNWAGMKAAGLIRGAYQYFEPGQDPTAQANLVIARVGRLGIGDLPVMLDVEATGGQSPATITARIHTWVDAITAGTGKVPFIYTGAYFWDASVRSADFAGLALNVAWYGTDCPGAPSAWNGWTFHQFTSSAHIPGVTGGVDADVFNGTLAQLQAFAGPAATPTPGAQQVAAALPAFTVAAGGLRLSSVGTQRLVDTRNTGALQAGQQVTAFTASQVGGAQAVSLGVTLIAPDADTFLSVTGGTGLSPTSSVNAKAGTVRANQTMVALTSAVASMRSLQRTHVVVDEQARFGASGAGFTAIGPTRVLDTRGAQPLAAGQVRVLPLGGAGVPASAVAAQLGLVALPRGAAGFISVIPCGEGVTTSALNFDASQVASSSALGSVRGGNVCLFSNVTTDVVVDLSGYFDVGGTSLFLSSPARILDTRTGEGGWSGMPTAGQVLRIELSAMPGWQGSSAVAFNLTGVGGLEQNFARVWDCTGAPTHSNLNGTPGTAVATFGVVRSTGSLCLVSNNPQHLILDLVGVYR
jgi:GH25 family lysozyme M1 (1,4-beta-N-acetylmuramidase)